MRIETLGLLVGTSVALLAFAGRAAADPPPSTEALPALGNGEPADVLPLSMDPDPPGSSPLRHRTAIDWHAMRAAGWTVLAIGAVTALAGGVVAYSSGYVKGDTTPLVFTGLGMVFGGGAVGAGGYVMLLHADKHVSSAPLPFRVAPLVARNAMGISLTGTF